MLKEEKYLFDEMEPVNEETEELGEEDDDPEKKLNDEGEVDDEMTL